MSSTKIPRELQQLLQDEIRALETYGLAVGKVRSEPGAQELRRIAADHAEAVALLRNQIPLEGGAPDMDTGTWGRLARAVEQCGNPLSDGSALRALRAGEEHGLREYIEVLEAGEVTDALRRVIREALMPRQQRHITALDRMIERQ